MVASNQPKPRRPKRPGVKLTIKNVEALKPGDIIWDSACAGLGARRQKGEGVAYVLRYRTTEGRQRWITIGRHGSPWTPDMARDEARRLLVAVVRGEDPQEDRQAVRDAPTVSDVADAYFADAESGRLLRRGREKKASTLNVDRARVLRHVTPLLGKRKINAVTSDDIEKFYLDVCNGKTAGSIKTERGYAHVQGGRGTAKRTLAVLSVIFSYAVKRKLRTDNPCRNIETHATQHRDRRLSDSEFAKLGEALQLAAQSYDAVTLAVIKFLALTGWRRSEALNLRWAELDLATRTATLSDTKTGKSVRGLSHAACNVLRALPRSGELVFPGPSGAVLNGSAWGQKFHRVLAMVGLPSEITPHTLRHSFASVAVDVGYSELTIAALLGHTKATVTSRYAHHADKVLLAAADEVADRIAALMGEPRGSGEVVELASARGC